MTAETSQVPFFSFVIPVYNRFQMVRDTLKSVLGQQNRNFEIVIVDDGSNDGSGQMLDDQYGNHGNIKIIHQANLERGAARNRGFRESRGDYVIFLDSDDILLPDHLDILYSKIMELGYPDFIATKYEFLAGGKRKNSSIGSFAEGYYDYRLFLDGNPLACNVCIRRSNKSLSLFEEDRSLAIKEDWLFFLKNLRHQKLYLVDKVTLLMVDHENRSMRGNNELLIAKTSLAREWIVRNVEMSGSDLRKLDAHANYFSAIHSYLDGHRKKPLQFLSRAIQKGGWRKKYFVLMAKVIIGRKTILRFIHGA